jgi:hypothetical protein
MGACRAVVYAHVLPRATAQAAERLEAAFGGAAGPDAGAAR